MGVFLPSTTRNNNNNMSFIVRVEYTHDKMSKTKAMRFDESKTVRELLFATSNNLAAVGCQIEDVINFNFQYFPESQQMVQQPESIAKEPFWLKKMKTLDSYGFTSGVTLRFDRASDFNLAVEETRSRTPSPATGRLNLSGENDKVKFLTKGRFTRDQAAKEIVTTEETYVEQLSVLLEHFIEPTIEKELISDPEIIKMFKHIRLIHGLHKELLREMEERVKNMSAATQLGDLFLKLMPFMKIYGEYCLNYETNVNNLFAIADSDQKLSAWIKVSKISFKQCYKSIMG